MSKIQDRLNELSPEERELHKDLIEECLRREKEINKHSKNIKENLSKLSVLEAKNREMLDTIHNDIKLLNIKLEEAKNSILLNSIADEEFYEA